MCDIRQKIGILVCSHLLFCVFNAGCLHAYLKVRATQLHVSSLGPTVFKGSVIFFLTVTLNSRVWMK